MTDIEWTPVKVRLGDLAHWAENPVTLTKAQAKKLLKSTEKLGRMQTLAVGPPNGDGKHPLYDGHQRTNVWGGAFGMDMEVHALQSSRPLTDEERHEVPIMLRTAAGSLDYDVLAGWTDWPITEWGLDSDLLSGLKCDIAALGNLLESETPEPQDTEPQFDKADALLEKWGCKTGDLFRIGDHRLLVGDSTKREDVERVMGGDKPGIMVTDPPYGVEYDPHWRDDVVGEFGQRDARGNGVQGDDIADWTLTYKLFTGDVAYIWHAGRRASEVQASLECCGFEIRNQIIWSKQHFAISRGNYHWQHEPCWYAVRTRKKSFWCGDRTQSTLWEIPSLNPAGRQEERFAHGTQKPLECMARPIRNHEFDIVYDPFVGSGTTIVACQNLSRRCRAIEISPAYCSVILERMSSAFPGIEIERIEST